MHILELTLLTKNLSETVQFYTEILEFECLENNAKFIAFKVGTSILRFELTEQEASPKYHFAFNIPLNQLSNAMAWLKQKTALIENEDQRVTTVFEKWKAEAIYFYDNNQNILEFIIRTDLNNSTADAFSAAQILCINEAGIVLDEPLDSGAEIIAQTQNSFFAKGPVRADFVAIGNDQGLFVISNPKRNWYPTNNKAEKHNVKVLIEVENTQYALEYN